jgi:predicted MFS family arabinose efflux permease
VSRAAASASRTPGRPPRGGGAVRAVRWSAGVSAFGDGTFRSAAPLLAVALEPDPRGVALVAMGTYAGWLTGPWCGALTDRLPRRSVLLWANAGRAAALGLFLVLLATGHGSIVALTVAAFVITVGNVFADAAAQALLPALLGTGVTELARQNGKLAMAETTGRSLLGLPLGSAAFGLSRVAPVAAHLLAFAGAAALATAVPRDTPPRPGRSLHADVAGGLAYLIRDRSLLAMSGLVAVFNLADTLAMSVFVLYAGQRLGVTAGAYGLLLTALAIGSVAGGWLGGRIAARVRWPWVQLAVFVSQGAAWTVVGWAGSAWPVAGALAVMGAASTVGTVSVVSTRQAQVPGRLLGRVVTGFRVLGNGAGLLGAFGGGLLAARLGIGVVPWFAAGLLGAFALALAGYLVCRSAAA